MHGHSPAPCANGVKGGETGRTVPILARSALPLRRFFFLDASYCHEKAQFLSNHLTGCSSTDLSFPERVGRRRTHDAMDGLCPEMFHARRPPELQRDVRMRERVLHIIPS